MNRKIKKFLSYPLRKQIGVVRIMGKNLVRKIKIFILGKFAKLFTSTRIGREVFYEIAPKNQLLLAHTTENIYYIVNTSDKVIGKSVYRDRKSYDSNHLTDALKLIPSKKSILIDVGANIGTIGILGVSKGYFEQCIAFEPEPNNFKILKHNVSLNGLSDRFNLKNEALSNVAHGSIEFELSENNFGDHRVRIITTSGRHNEADREVISVAVNTIDKALKDVKLDKCVLFMDTQGFEGHVLSGARKLIEANVPIITEFWPYGLKRSGGIDLFYEVLINSGYTSMWDLKSPATKMQFSIEQIKAIASNLGDDGKFTDLLFVTE